MLLGVLVLVSGLGLGGCAEEGPDPTAPTRQVLLIGVEALSWDRIDPLLEAGELPNLARLIGSGARGVALAPDPLESQSLWATALTGKGLAKHQMVGGLATLPSGQRAMAPSSMRVSKTVFQIAGEADGVVAHVGFPGTWPVEVVVWWATFDTAAALSRGAVRYSVRCPR